MWRYVKAASLWILPLSFDDSLRSVYVANVWPIEVAGGVASVTTINCFIPFLTARLSTPSQACSNTIWSTCASTTPFIKVDFLAAFKSLRKRHLLLVLGLRFKLEWTLCLAGVLRGSDNVDAFFIIIIAFRGPIQRLVLILIYTLICFRYFILVRVVIFAIKIMINMLRIRLADSTNGGFFLISGIAILCFVISSNRPRFFEPLLAVEQLYNLENFFGLDIVHLFQGLQMIGDVWKPGDWHGDILESLKSLCRVWYIVWNGLISDLNGRTELSYCRWDQSGLVRR